MAYTSRLKIRRRDETYYLDKMSYNELSDLRSRLRFDIADINNQIEIHDVYAETGTSNRDKTWRGRSVSAAKIKIHDIGKINDVIESLDVVEAVTDTHIDLTNINIHKLLTNSMKGIIPEEKMALVLDRVYSELNRGAGS